MKKFQHIIALTIIITLASSTNLYADNCSNAGVTTGQTCWGGDDGGNIPYTVSYATNCSSSSAGCVFINCISSCTCNTPSYTCPSGSSANCSSVTCNPIWGAIDSSTHIQTGKQQTADTSNGCKCKEDTSGFASTIYRCIAGYYDSTTGMSMIGSKPTCAKCPSIGNNNVAGQSDTGITRNPANKGITSCYIPYDTEIKDDTGTYIFTYSQFQIQTGNGCKWKE